MKTFNEFLNENKIVKEDGTIEYRNSKGQLHRKDGPAVERKNGDKVWYLNGEKHREDGPAIEWADGTTYWYINGKLHREDGPAVETAFGHKSYYLNDKKYNRTNFNKKMGIE